VVEFRLRRRVRHLKSDSQKVVLIKTPIVVNEGQRDRHHQNQKNSSCKNFMVSSVQRMNVTVLRSVSLCIVCGLESLAAHVKARPPIPTEFNLPTLSDL